MGPRCGVVAGPHPDRSGVRNQPEEVTCGWGAPAGSQPRHVSWSQGLLRSNQVVNQVGHAVITASSDVPGIQNNGHGCPLHVPWRAGPRRVCSHPVPTRAFAHSVPCTWSSLFLAFGPQFQVTSLAGLAGHSEQQWCPLLASLTVSASLGNGPGLPMVGPLLSVLLFTAVPLKRRAACSLHAC